MVRLAMPHRSGWRFSPRAWGWSVSQAHDGSQWNSSPHVRGDGPDIAGHGAYTSRRSPHVRGDGPDLRARLIRERQFSPRAWGWSAVARPLASSVGFSPRAWGWSGGTHGRAARQRVLPTCVGMVRGMSRAMAPDLVLPTCVGMVRHPSFRPGPERSFSPRAWGWSATGPVIRRRC